MNDFTKEELETLRWAIDEVRYCNPLSYKIQSLIDNYCDHENTVQCNISEQVVCKDCGEEVHE